MEYWRSVEHSTACHRAVCRRALLCCLPLRSLPQYTTPHHTMITLAVVTMIELHAAGGQVIQLNPKTIVSMRIPRHGEHFAPGTKCFISTLDGKFVAVTDPCDRVRELLR